MKLDLSEIATHLGKRIKYEIDEPPIVDADSGLSGVENIKGEATFSNTGNHIVIRGRFRTVINIECARCLKIFKMDIDLPIEEELPIHGHIPGLEDEYVEVEGELPEEQEPLFEDNIFNLTEFLRQSILVSIPMQTLCSEACEGLCPRCGKNLNDGACECLPEKDSPFAALASLFEDKMGEEETNK